MLAHLACLANFFFPFAGVIGALVVYTLRRSDPSFVRENARNALNEQITLAIFNTIVIVCAIGVLTSLMFTAAIAQHHRGQPSAVFPWQLLAYFGCFLILMLANVTVAIISCFAARTAYLGRVFRYPFAIPFVREALPLA
jgi:uncharacterized Tic20 family protein